MNNLIWELDWAGRKAHICDPSNQNEEAGGSQDQEESETPA